MKKFLQFKNEISGLQDVYSTVKTVEKIAASNIHSLKSLVSTLEDFNATLESMLSRLMMYHPKITSPLLRQDGIGKKALLVISGDKGLVGGLYHSQINRLLEMARNYDFIAIVGNKGNGYAVEEQIRVNIKFNDFNLMPEVEAIDKIADFWFERFRRKQFNRVDILYNKFVNLSVHHPSLEAFLPFKFEGFADNDAKLPLGFPDVSPNKKLVFSELFSRYVKVKLQQIFLEAKLSEFSARTVSMEHAAVKTQDAINRTKLDYFKERRKQTTQRQLISFIDHLKI